MQYLNLAAIGASDVNFRTEQFPDGQQGIVITGPMVSKDAWLIISRLSSFKDLELIICATQALRSKGVTDISLRIPYLLGARSDRRFHDRGLSYLRDVIAPIINIQDYRFVEVLDVHNPAVADACINNLAMVSNANLVSNYLREHGRKVTILCPDEGAAKKIFSLVEALDWKTDIVTCSKSRDLATGRITGIELPSNFTINSEGENFVIIDDICDGGGTFIGIADALYKLNQGRVNYNIDLVVTHGIFSQGLEKLSHYFSSIWTTNSYASMVTTEKLKVYNVF